MNTPLSFVFDFAAFSSIDRYNKNQSSERVTFSNTHGTSGQWGENGSHVYHGKYFKGQPTSLTFRLDNVLA